jgi:predicted dehydrogenase
MRKVKLAVLGCGFVGQGVHLPNFLSNPKCEVLGICDVRRELAARVAKRFGLPRVWRDDEELAQDPEVEAVAAIVPHSHNPPIALRLLNAGKHVFIEKPMADCVDDARKMAAAASQAGRILMVAYMKRYDTGVQWARDAIQRLSQDGELGPCTFARAHCFGGDWIAGYPRVELKSEEPAPKLEHNLPSWVPQHERESYAGFNGVYTHQLNLLRFFLGPGRVLAAHRQGNSYLVAFDFGGVLVSLEAGSMDSRRWEEETFICFKSGWLRMETPTPLLRNVPALARLYVAGRQEIIQPRPEWRWSFEAEADHFLDCILAGQQPLSSGDDTVADVELVEQVFRCLLEK